MTGEYINFQDASQDSKGYIAHNHLEDGCPNFIPKNKVYNVLKYYSDYRNYLINDYLIPDVNTCLPTPTKSLGVVSDGLNLDDQIAYNARYYYSTGSSIIGDKRFLNISNNRSASDNQNIYNDNCDPSIMSLPLDDELRPKDGNGDFIFHLFEKSVSRTIVDPKTSSESSETVDSMEFMFFHTKIEKCQRGWVWLELHDFELSGWDNDNQLYAYFWESSQEDSANISAQLDSNPTSYEGFKRLAGENRCVQAMRLSDITGGTDKKLIIGCNRFVFKGEEVYINLLVGLKPSDVCRYYQFKNKGMYTDPNDANTFLGYEVLNCNFDEVGSDVIFKYKKAEFKFGGKFEEKWNNRPLFYPDEGFIKTLPGPNSRILRGAWQFLDSSKRGQTAANVNTTYIGFPNGGYLPSENGGDIFDVSFAVPNFNIGASTGLASISLAYYSSYTMFFDIAQFFMISSAEFKAGGMFRMRLPRAMASWSGTATSFDDQLFGGLPLEIPDSFSSAGINVSLYVGDDIGISENQVQWHVLSDSLYKLETWTLDEFCSTNRAPYDYEALVNQQFTHKNHLQNGFPRHVPNEDSNKIDNFRYVDIDIDDIVNNVGSIPFFFFFLVLETGSTGIKNGALHYSVYDDNSHPDYFQYLPTGYHPEDEPVNYTVAQLILKTEYDVVMTPGAYNYGGFVSKIPQIIDSGTKTSPEDYYR